MSGSIHSKAALFLAAWFVWSSAARGGIFEFGERPLGTEANRNAAEYLATEAERMGYEVTRLPFKCARWVKGPSFLDREGARVEVFPGPFSPAYDKWCDAVLVTSTQQLKRTKCEGKIVFLRGPIAKEPLMPLDYPFYFPERHKEIYALLDERKPAAIVAVTGKHPACGLEPYPLFDDASFKIPTGYLDAAAMDRLLEGRGKMRLMLDSKSFPETGEQVVARKKAAGASQGKIVVFAHMDTAYGTQGALDNSAGVAVLLAAMARLKNYAGPYDLEFIPFNGEDSPMVKGETTYLARYGRELSDIQLAINIFAPGAKGSQTAVSAYNLDEDRQTWLDGEIAKHPQVKRGPEWVESDHSIFVFQGVPCLAVTSSNLRDTVMAVTHTPRDTIDLVDRNLLLETVDFIVDAVNEF